LFLLPPGDSPFGMSLAISRWRRCETIRQRSPQLEEEIIMGKYFLAWLLGVPAFVLVIVYLFFN